MEGNNNEEIAKEETVVEAKELPKKSNKTVITLIVVIVLLVAVIVTGFFYIQSSQSKKDKEKDKEVEEKDDKNDVVDEVDDNKDDKKEEDKVTDKVEETKDPYKVISWDGKTPYKPTFDYYKEDIESVFTKHATLNNGAIIVESAYGHLSYVEDYFIVFTNGEVRFLKNYSIAPNDYLTTSVKIESSIKIPEMFPENDITYKSNTLVFVEHGSGFAGIKEDKLTKVGTLPYGDLYEEKADVGVGFYSRRFFVKTKNGAYHRFDLKNADIYNDDRTLNVKWDDDSNKKITWEMPMSNCGTNGERLHINFTPDKGVKVGTANGKTLYQLKDETLLKVLYDEYYSPGDYEGAHNLSFADFKAQFTSVVYQDSFGEYVVLENDKYSHAGECGKPVIYLYPEKATSIDVEVFADVTVSAPLYPIGGWKNVLALPNGNLIYKARLYDSLFWEGIGLGTYPDVRNVGKVVLQKDLIKTIKEDLEAQGLNEKEISDFLEFWKDHLPTAPYVKLSWFTTEEMNTLAPLRVNPNPKTVIRVFLDAKGLDAPIPLTPQTFTKPERVGFTLVEWGGLLRK